MLNNEINLKLKELKNEGKNKVRLIIYHGSKIAAVAEFYLTKTDGYKPALLKSGKNSAFIKAVLKNAEKYDSFSAYSIDEEDTRGC